MPTLLDIQRSMADAVLSGRDDAIIGALAERGVATAACLAIHRGTATRAVTEALRSTFPAVDRLVGPAFFDGAAAHFIDAAPPRSAWLDLYGDGFADFLADFAPAAGVPYLADVARLEWAIARVAAAADVVPLTPLDLAALPEAERGAIRLAAHPAFRMIAVDYAVDDIVAAVVAEPLPGEPDTARFDGLDLRRQRRYFVVQRNQAGVAVRAHDGASHAWLMRACAGEPLVSLLDAPGLDTPRPEAIITLFAEHLAAGSFIRRGDQ